MKVSVALLLASLAVNAAVITLYVKRSPGSATAARSAALPAAAATPSLAGTSGESATLTAAPSAQLAKGWAELQSGDLNTLPERLRAAGFSPSMVRAIVAAQVYEQFAARRKEIIGQQPEQPFWQTSRNAFMDPKTTAALRDLNKEQTALMKSLLGPGGAPGGDEAAAWHRRQFGNLAPEKLAQLQSITADYSELQQEVHAKANGTMLAEDREKLAFLEKEKLADIARTLSPQEFEDFQLRSGNTAQQLRNQLSGFNTTEAEFRALYKVTAAIDEKYGTNNPFGSRNSGDIQNRQTELLAQMQTVLSPERFAEYKLATDPQAQQVSRLVARLELPPATTQQVVALQTDFQTRARALQTNRDLPVAERTAQQAALLQEATAKLTAALTPRGLEAYKQHGGFWLESLKPRPTPTPTAR